MLEQPFLSPEDCRELKTFLSNTKKFVREVLRTKLPPGIRKEFISFDTEILDSYGETFEFINKFGTNAVRDLLEGFCEVFGSYLQFLKKYKGTYEAVDVQTHIFEVEGNLEKVKEALTKQGDIDGRDNL